MQVEDRRDSPVKSYLRNPCVFCNYGVFLLFRKVSPFVVSDPVVVSDFLQIHGLNFASHPCQTQLHQVVNLQENSSFKNFENFGFRIHVCDKLIVKGVL